MVRIKGENSDYKYNPETGTIQEVQPPPDRLYLQLFICPHDHPSAVEPNTGEESCCRGIDRHCPEARSDKPAAGHALLRLDRETGLSLVTDRDNRIDLDQAGKIHLSPSSSGRVEIHGRLLARVADLPTPIELEASDRGIRLRAGSAEVTIDPEGNIELIPGPRGKVRVHGDVEIRGQLDTELSEATRRAIVRSILAELSATREGTL